VENGACVDDEQSHRATLTPYVAYVRHASCCE
jgi:hypothetical protein